MLNMRIGELVKVVKGDLVIGDPNSMVGRVVIDTRIIKKGDFFIALKGRKFDAHDFVNQAFEKNASGLMVDNLSLSMDKNPWNLGLLPHIVKVNDTLKSLQDLSYWHRKKFNLSVTAVTGTNGKTTAKEMLASIFAQDNSVLCTRGNLNNHIGLPLMMLEIEDNHKYAVFELGASMVGDIAQLAGLCRPNIGVITNIGMAHIESFGSMENILKTKWELIECLPDDGFAVLNADDEMLVKNFTKCRCNIVTYGIKNQADITAEDISLWPNTQFTMIVNAKRYRIQIPVIGLFNIYNALAAAAVAWSSGLNIERILKGLEEFSAPPMHMQVLRISNTNVLVNDAYNANPNSMRESINAFVTMYAIKRKVLVLGMMNELGEMASMEHQLLGEFLAAQAVDKVFWVGGFGENVKKGLFEKYPSKIKFKICDSKSDLVNDLVAELDNPCAVLFKGSRCNELEVVVEAVKESYKPK